VTSRDLRAVEGLPPEESSDAWHLLEADDVLERLGAVREGLTADAAGERLARYGANTVEVRKPVSPWAIVRHQFQSVVVWLLVVATGVAQLIGDFLEAAAIAVVLVINVAVGFWTEWRARIAVDALRKLQVHEAVVLRDGHRVKMAASSLVPGDVVVLSEGAAVPADARLLTADELRVEEAALTGESEPVSKSVEPVVRGGDMVGVGDRTSMVFKGTTVARGAAEAVVVATGTGTELGKIGALVSAFEHAPTPIERRLDVLGRRLVWLTLGVAALVILAGLLGGWDPWLVVQTGLALAIAAVPEGLPVVATITLAVGMWRMARRNALVRRPPAVEALGSATVICADKTGTLTTGKMAVTSVLTPRGRADLSVEDGGVLVRVEGRTVSPEQAGGLRELVRGAVLANEARLESLDGGWRGIGDPTDVAILNLGMAMGMERAELLNEAPEEARMPFTSERMLMASFHREPEGTEAEPVEVHVKGALERVLPLCSAGLGPDGPQPLGERERQEVSKWEGALASEGLRVLAVASGRTTTARAGTEDALEGLTLLGLIGLMDPPAPHVADTIARFRGAGVRTLMITGDQPATARSIAERLGMLAEGERVVTGVDLSRMDDGELAQVVAEASIFGRVSPQDKLRLVEALLEQGEVVGMLGDGVNDAPALKRADIGVAMGRRGTDVAKGVADLVLADDRLETVAVAVEEGRVIFDNIRKFVFYLFSCNLSEVGVVLGASLAGAPLPLLPLQLLWLNVVTDVFPALALSAEPAEPDVMRRPRRPKDAPILSRGFLTTLGGYAGVLTASTLGVFAISLSRDAAAPGYAVTMAFMTLALAQLAHAFNARRFGPLGPGVESVPNRWLSAALAFAVLLQLAAVYVPTLQQALGTVPLAPADWLLAGGAALVPLVAGQVWKRIVRARQSSRNDARAAREALGRSS
jgi:Ca2+-transporting ATPase